MPPLKLSFDSLEDLAKFLDCKIVVNGVVYRLIEITEEMSERDGLTIGFNAVLEKAGE